MKKRKFLLLSLLSSLSLLAWETKGLGILAAGAAQSATVYTGVAAGDATSDSAVLWTRTIASGREVLFHPRERSLALV